LPCLSLFVFFETNNFQTIWLKDLLYHKNSFYVLNPCAKLYRKLWKSHIIKNN
jgi:hypothetical protein